MEGLVGPLQEGMQNLRESFDGNGKYVLYGVGFLTTYAVTKTVMYLVAAILQPVVFVLTAAAIYSAVVYIKDGPEAFDGIKEKVNSVMDFTRGAFAVAKKLAHLG